MATTSSFASPSAYLRAVSQTPQRLAQRLTAVGTAEAELHEVKARSGPEMQRRLRWYDVMGLGIGGMIGAGIFVTTGAAVQLSGPAVIVSYAVASIAALLSAFCYTEFAVEVPTAGGAFSYLRITFGEFAAYLTGANLIMEYVVSNAAVARSFTSYLATVFGQCNDMWRVKAVGLASGYNMLDFPAVALVGIITMFICCSTKNSSRFNVLITIFHLSLIAFIVIAGFAEGSVSNLYKPGKPESPGGFAPYGVRGIFDGAAIVYFSYIGYDSVSTLAEEVHKPAKTMPMGISGSVVVVTVLYCLMAASLVVLVPYDQIDKMAAFSVAFKHTSGWKWACNLVGVGACIGILSSLLVSMLGQSRYLCVIGRANLIPGWFARVHSSTGTPVHASIFLGVCTAVVALFTELDILVDLISIGTLFVFYMVANALIFRRYVSIEKASRWRTLAFLVAISGLSIVFATFWHLGDDHRLSGLIFSGGFILLLTVGFKAVVPPVDQIKEWKAPLMPFLAVASIFMNVFLGGSLPAQAFWRFAIWSGGSLLFYLAYSVHATYDAEAAFRSSKATTGLQLQVHVEKLSTVTDTVQSHQICVARAANNPKSETPESIVVEEIDYSRPSAVPIGSVSSQCISIKLSK